ASLARVGLELRCQCIETYSNPSLRGHIASVNLIKSGPHCSNIQVIATLKDARRVCLDPTAPWVKKVITNLLEKYKINPLVIQKGTGNKVQKREWSLSSLNPEEQLRYVAS
ncbi:hypothetical protein L345_16329, partial [Ophiophagus hannah]